MQFQSFNKIIITEIEVTKLIFLDIVYMSYDLLVWGVSRKSAYRPDDNMLGIEKVK